jgi:hypothetical protein
MLFKISVCTSKRTPYFTITKINWLTLFKFNNAPVPHDLTSRPGFATRGGNYECVELVVRDNRDGWPSVLELASIYNSDLPKRLVVAKLVNKFPPFIEPQASIPSSQESCTGPYLQPVGSNMHIHIPLPTKIFFQFLFPHVLHTHLITSAWSDRPVYSSVTWSPS